ncbi:MAG: squalene/phytoene synthase family protein [Acidobacteria bacterium]|nr:squalene/phytoene synthase family protein [Acidobacteriota bacterium]
MVQSPSLERLLRDVSRSFYLTLAILPRAVKPQLRLAYLLARATDTVADTEGVPAGRRREILAATGAAIRDCGSGRRGVVPDFSDILSRPGPTEGERRLLGHFGEVLGRLGAFDAEDRAEVCGVLETITAGQDADLVRFGGCGPDRIGALDTDEELQLYTYRVAGCVGEFWTRLCLRRLFPGMLPDRERLLQDAVRFGKGLQLVNILRDLPRDLAAGRCYIPSRRMAKYGLRPADLGDGRYWRLFRPLYARYLGEAEEHLAAGWRYTTALPFRSVRVRLASAWPLLIGVRTLGLLRSANALDGTARVKVGRGAVRGLILRSLLLYPFRAKWDRLFDEARALTSPPPPGRSENGAPPPPARPR